MSLSLFSPDYAAWFGQWDIDLLTTLRSLVSPQDTLAPYVALFADAPVIIMAIFLVVWWLTGVVKSSQVYRRDALLMFFLIASVFIVYGLLNQLLPERPRPESIVAGIAPLIEHKPDNSFPSGHAAFVSASLVGLFIVFRSWVVTSVATILGIAMCIARVISGVHYPSDILFGWIVGGLTAYTMYRLIVRYHVQVDRYLFDPLLRLARIFHL